MADNRYEAIDEAIDEAIAPDSKQRTFNNTSFTDSCNYNLMNSSNGSA